MGCNLAAREAGYQPKRIPMPAETTKARIIDQGEMTNKEPNNREIINEIKIPIKIPITPPVKVRITDSVKN